MRSKLKAPNSPPWHFHSNCHSWMGAVTITELSFYYEPLQAAASKPYFPAVWVLILFMMYGEKAAVLKRIWEAFANNHLDMFLTALFSALVAVIFIPTESWFFSSLFFHDKVNECILWKYLHWIKMGIFSKAENKNRMEDIQNSTLKNNMHFLLNSSCIFFPERKRKAFQRKKNLLFFVSSFHAVK